MDKAEHERVTTALTAAQTQLAEVQADVGRLKPLADQAPSLQAKVDSLQVGSCFCIYVYIIRRVICYSH